MNPSQKRKLEQLDLTAIHEFFDHRQIVDLTIREYPKLTISKNTDLWTDAIYAAVEQKEDSLKAVHASVSLSDLPEDSVSWWNKVFAVAEKAPLGEFEKLLKGKTAMPNEFNSDCFKAAGDIIAEWGRQREFQLRKKKVDAEKKKLDALQGDVSDKRKNLAEAQSDLNRHTKQR